MVPNTPKGIAIFTLKMIAAWTVAAFVFQFVRNFGIEEYPHVELTEEVNLQRIISLSLLIGFFSGIFYSFSEIQFNKPYFQKLSLGRLLIIKTVSYFILVKILFFLVIVLILREEMGGLKFEVIKEIMTGKTFWVVLTFFIVVSTLITFILIVSQKFGPGMLWKLLTGKYHKPREEERIFLFVDLQSSTTIAERLGHLDFSNLIQDCFFDLTDVIVRHRVDIYQYVGDEAILSWEKEVGIKNQRCIQAYFDFMEILNKKSDYYQNAYGVSPFFKAGLHAGTVTAAEVGVIKKEIAYHGDVLNTTARIQGECNTYQQALLASEDIIEDLETGGFFKTEFMGEPILKGKEKRVKIFGVTRV